MMIEVAAETVDECFRMLSCSRLGERSSNAILTRRTAAWEEAFRLDSSGSLRQRLLKEGKSRESITAQLATLPSWTSGHGWANDLNWLVNSIESTNEPSAPTPYGKTYPFADLLHSICLSASSRIRSAPSSCAVIPLQEGLLARLSAYAAPALYEEFAIFREAAASQRNDRPQAADRIYQSFVREMRNGSFQTFLMEHPALTRLIVGLTNSWLLATEELLDRVSSDVKTLSWITGGSDCSAEYLTSIQPNLSDPHNGGRTVHLLTFASGARLLYKPRPLGMDRIWTDLLSWLESYGGPAIGNMPRFADMGNYGWQAYCESTTTISPSRFYRRLGACLALFRALGSSDMHHENVIACADQPIFVDVETLVAPIPEVNLSPHPAIHAAEEQLLFSVWRSGALPDATLLPTGDVMSHGALAESPHVSGSYWGYVNANSDAMRFVQLERPKQSFFNIPRDSSGIAPPSRFAGDILAGFDEAITVIRERWEDFWGSSGPIRTLSTVPIRAIFRPTAVYGSILHMLRDPRRARSGIAWSSRLEELHPSVRDDFGILSSSALLAAERRALSQGDIPFFITREGETSVWDFAGDEVPNAVRPVGRNLGAPPCRVTREEIDRDRQLIKWSLDPSPLIESRPWPHESSDTLTQQHLFSTEIERLLELVNNRAVIADKGVAWWGRKSLLKAANIGVLGVGLYDGLAGILVFLAAAAKVLGDGRASKLSEAALVTLRAMIRVHRPTPLRPGRTLGVAFGMAGVTYGVVTAARLLGDDSLLDIARDAASWISTDIISADRTFDVMDGSAGALVSLLHLYKQTGEERWFAAALACGRHLAKSHQSSRWWAAPGNPISAGMAHGVAGIGFALSRLSRIGDAQEFSELSLESLKFVDRAYDYIERDWSSDIPDPSTKRQRRFWCRWCHGALGIGLAWHDQANTVPSKSVRAIALARATQAAIEHPSRPVDTLCCGNFGNVDYLLEVADGDVRLEVLARSRAEWLIREARRRGCYRFEGCADEETLGLFQGISGIGYVLLRALAQQRLPSLSAFS